MRNSFSNSGECHSGSSAAARFCRALGWQLTEIRTSPFTGTPHQLTMV